MSSSFIQDETLVGGSDVIDPLSTSTSLRTQPFEITPQSSGFSLQLHPQSLIGISSAVVGSSLGSFVSLTLIYLHLLHYRVPSLQKSVIRIVLTIPVYSVLSLCSLIFSKVHIFFDAIRDVWEAIVVYCFLSLILDYCGGENGCALVIQQAPGSIVVPWPLFKCMPSPTSKVCPILFRRQIPLNPRFVKTCKQSALQFVAVKPVVAILMVLLVITGRSDILSSPGWMWSHGIVYNVSYTLALYALALFYAATKSHPGLQGSKPLRKFAAVKIIVFATFWQSVLMFILFHSRSASAELRAWNHWLLCIEMPFIAFLQVWAYPVAEFIGASGASTREARREEKSLKHYLQRGKSNAFHQLGDYSENILNAPQSTALTEMQQLQQLDGQSLKAQIEVGQPGTINEWATVVPSDRLSSKKAKLDIIPDEKVESGSVIHVLAVEAKMESTNTAIGGEPSSFRNTEVVTDLRAIKEENYLSESIMGGADSENQISPKPAVQCHKIEHHEKSFGNGISNLPPHEELQRKDGIVGNFQREFDLTYEDSQSPSVSSEGPSEKSKSSNEAAFATNSESEDHLGFLKTPLRLLQKQLDAVRDPESRKLALSNAIDVISVKDVVRDAYYTFGRRYANHSLLDFDSAGVQEENLSGDGTSGRSSNISLSDLILQG